MLSQLLAKNRRHLVIVTFVVMVMVVSLLVVLLLVTVVGLVKDLRFLPIVTLAGHRSEKQTGGEQVKRFHLRAV